MSDNSGWETLDGQPIEQIGMDVNVDTAPSPTNRIDEGPPRGRGKGRRKRQLPLGLPDVENVYTGEGQFDTSDTKYFANFALLKPNKKKAAHALGRGRSVGTVAQAAGVSKRTISDWFKGDEQFRLGVREITSAYIRESFDFGARASALSMDYLISVVQCEDCPTSERMKAAMFIRRDFIDTQRTQALMDKMLELERMLILDSEDDEGLIIENRPNSIPNIPKNATPD